VKTQIIQLDPHDDAISVKDKMGWGQTPRILLVWPRKAKILNRRVDLTYLKRHSKSLGAQLAFVTKDADVRYYAAKLGIPIYKTTQKAEESHWRRPRRNRRKQEFPSKNIETNHRTESKTDANKAKLDELHPYVHPEPIPWLIHPATRLILFTLGVLGVLAITTVLVPSAEITVKPKTQLDSISIPITASLDNETMDLSGVVPVRTISLIVEGRGKTISTGHISIPDTKSSGKVIFTNVTDKEILIPSGTIVSTFGENPARFTTLENLTIPPASKSELTPIEAISPGVAGNALSNHIIAIEGLLGLDLTVTNPIGIYNGEDKPFPAPNDRDYDKLFVEMLTDLYQAALEELKFTLGPNDLILLTDPENYSVLEEIYKPSEIQPADQLFLTLRVDFQVYIASGEDLKILGESVLGANLPKGFSPMPSTLEITQKSLPSTENESDFEWDMEASWQISASVDIDQTITHALWLKPEEATRKLIKSLPIEQGVSIRMTPKWWPRLPILPFRITVITLN